VKTVRDECLNHLVLFGERHLRPLIKEFVEHYCWVSQCTSLLCA
jgi:hypothetical protein